MGSYTTVRVSRSTAERLWQEKQKCQLDNEELGEDLDKLRGSESLYHYVVVDNDEVNDENEYFIY